MIGWPTMTVESILLTVFKQVLVNKLFLPAYRHWFLREIKICIENSRSSKLGRRFLVLLTGRSSLTRNRIKRSWNKLWRQDKWTINSSRKYPPKSKIAAAITMLETVDLSHSSPKTEQNIRKWWILAGNFRYWNKGMPNCQNSIMNLASNCQRNKADIFRHWEGRIRSFWDKLRWCSNKSKPQGYLNWDREWTKMKGKKQYLYTSYKILSRRWEP